VDTKLKLATSNPHQGDSEYQDKARRREKARTLTPERDWLMEQIQHIREFAERMMAQSEAKDTVIQQLTAVLAAKDRQLVDMEFENNELIKLISSRQERIQSLERFLKTMAEADEQLDYLVE